MKYCVCIFLMLLILFGAVFADGADARPRIEINIPSQTLRLYKGGMLVKQYPVCVGRASTPTPLGEFNVVYKTVDPYWLNNGKTVPPGPENPLGIRWIGITQSIGIHGNNQPDSIGTLTSSGCIRMYNKDVAELYEQVPVGTPVTIQYECAEMFEDPYNKEKAAAVYPDFYKQNKKYEAALLKKLESGGLAAALLERVRDLMKSDIKEPAAAAEGIGVFLNGRLIAGDAFNEGGEVYIGCRTAMDVLGLSPEFLTGSQVAVRERDHTVYINLSSSAKQLNWDMHFDDKKASAFIQLKAIKVNGVFLTQNYGNDDKQSLIGVESLKALGYEYEEDNVDVTLFDGRYVKVRRNGKNCIGLQPLIVAFEGEKTANSLLDSIDISIPPLLKKNGSYYKTAQNEYGVFAGREAAVALKPETAAERETGNREEWVPLESLMEGLHYRVNEFGTLIEVLDEGESEAASN